MKFLLNDFDYIILDLDNTLYDEYCYIETCISNFLDEINYSDKKVKDWKGHFHKFYVNRGNNKVFDDFIQKYFEISRIHVDAFLWSLRIGRPNIDNLVLFPGVLEFLNLHKNKIIIVTDGNVKQQQRKIKLLKLNDYIFRDRIFYADKHDGKSSRCFHAFIADEFKDIMTARGIVIGDNPDSDGVLAKNLNFQYFNINENSNFFRKYM